MPTRRTSPRRTATRPSGAYERPSGPAADDLDDADPPSLLTSAAPWLAVLAVVLAAGALGFLVFGRGGADLTACRQAAWGAIPSEKSLPDNWALGASDLNANGMTISILGPGSADGSTDQPVVVVSVTCYGDAAGTALDANRAAAEKVHATVASRTNTGDSYDVTNPATGSTTTFFRIGQLVAQVADSGPVTNAERDKVTTALATAMGDATAAGTAPPDEATGSDEPLGSDDLGAGESAAPPFAPELEAVLPHSIVDNSSTGSPAAPIPLTVLSSSATEIFGQDPSSRALAARIRSMGGTLDELQIAQAYDETGAIDLSIIAFRLPKADLGQLRSAVIDTWLSAGAQGVKATEVTLGGKPLTKIDYGDGATTEYVYAKDDYVVVMDTSDVDIATQVATQLK